MPYYRIELLRAPDLYCAKVYQMDGVRESDIVETGKLVESSENKSFFQFHQDLKNKMIAQQKEKAIPLLAQYGAGWQESERGVVSAVLRAVGKGDLEEILLGASHSSE